MTLTEKETLRNLGFKEVDGVFRIDFDYGYETISYYSDREKPYGLISCITTDPDRENCDGQSFLTFNDLLREITN